MKLLIYFSAIFSVILFSYKETEVSAQGVQTFYGGGPVAYSQGSDDDDIGLLLTVLLLATKNRGNGGCCGCCSCGSNNIPIPYPIPIPTNNPVITMSGYDDGGAGGGSQVTEEINIRNEDTSNVETDADLSSRTDNHNDSEAVSQSDAGAEAEAYDERQTT